MTSNAGPLHLAERFLKLTSSFLMQNNRKPCVNPLGPGLMQTSPTVACTAIAEKDNDLRNY